MIERGMEGGRECKDARMRGKYIRGERRMGGGEEGGWKEEE